MKEIWILSRWKKIKRIIDVRKRPMCWLAIGFLLIICMLLLGRSVRDVLSMEDGQNNQSSFGLYENEVVLVEGVITSKEYKESIYGGYWQVVLKKVAVWNQKHEVVTMNEESDWKQDHEDLIEREIILNKNSQLLGFSVENDRRIAKLEGKYLCQITSKETMNLQLGQRILLEAKFVSWEKPTNEGQFDSAKYYISQGILGQFKKGKVIKTGEKYDILKENMWEFRQNVQEILQQYLGKRDGGLISAMLLGEKSNLEMEDKSLYQRNGISHILAISGLHLSLLGMGIYNILLRIMPGKKQAAVLCIIIMSLYCVFTGNSISTIRATIMFALSLLATILGRSYDSLSALGLTAILQLFFNPYVLNNSGFLLSFLAVIGVTFLAPRLQYLFSCKKRWEKSLCVSLSATLTTLPVILVSYGTYPWYSVFLNLLVLPAMSLLLLCAILLIVLVGMFEICFGISGGSIAMQEVFFYGSSAVQEVVANGSSAMQEVVANGNIAMQEVVANGSSAMQEMMINENALVNGITFVLKMIIKLILHYFEFCCEGFEKLIYQDSYIGAPGWIAICVYGILLVIVASDKIVESLFFRKMLLLCALSILTMRIHTGVEINMLDVGQGDCIVVRNSNGNVYISDCGSSSVSKVGQYRLLPFLKHKGYGNIKGIFVSHLDEDHMNGILELLESAPVEHVKIEYLFMPESVLLIEEDLETLKEIMALASKNGTKIIYLSQGEEIQDGELRFSCWYPTSSVKRLDRNNSSLVLLMEYQDFEMLFTGDVEMAGEQEIVSEVLNKGISQGKGNEVLNKERRIDVLKVAHHGSSGSSCEEFLRAIQPKISLISCGKNNTYGHPHEETLERLEACGTKIYSTVDSGEITLKIRRRRVEVREFKE